MSALEQPVPLDGPAVAQRLGIDAETKVDTAVRAERKRILEGLHDLGTLTTVALPGASGTGADSYTWVKVCEISDLIRGGGLTS